MPAPGSANTSPPSRSTCSKSRSATSLIPDTQAIWSQDPVRLRLRVLAPARDNPREAGHPHDAALAKAAEPAPEAIAQRSTPCGRERVVQIGHRHLRLHAYAVIERGEGRARVDPFLAHLFEARTTHEPGQPPRPRKPQRMRDR